MFIGSKSNSTIFDVFQIGFQGLVRECGIPAVLRFNTEGCQIYASGGDLTKRIDRFRLQFSLKQDVTEAALQESVKALGVQVALKVSDRLCTIDTPSFEWNQVAQLVSLDTMIERFAPHSMRSQTWTIEVEKYIASSFNINRLVEEMVGRNASDLHLRAGNRPYLRIDNDLTPMDLPVLSSQDMRDMVYQLGGESQLNYLETEQEGSFQYHAAGLAYLRCSGYIKGGAMAMAVRMIPEAPLPLEKLNLPESVKNICYKHRGLFLVCGITGSGKSTTLASMVDYINQERMVHIITVEDPVEFVYFDKKSIVSQRQVGRDTASFANALRGALREDPDVILVGEMRDVETIRAGLSAAETGHLVFSTLHTTSATDTVNRIISYFPQNERDMIRQELAHTVQGILCQRLVKKIGGGRVPCVELLFGGSKLLGDAIEEGELDKIYGLIESDSTMQTFDQHAVELYQKGIITRESALSVCKDEEGFQRILSGIKTSGSRRMK